MFKAKIKSIKYLGEDRVFDLKVPDHNNFILANDILVHNCGKSTLAYQLARSIQRVPDRVKGEYTFNPQRDILYRQKDVLHAINTRWKSIIFVDEAIAVSFNREFMSDNNKNLVKAMNMNRDHQNIILFCIPVFSSIDTQMKAMIKMRVSVIKRGIGIVQTPMKSIYQKDSWDHQTNEKIEREWSERGVSKPRYNRLTTFRGYIRFKDLPAQHRELYEKIKVEKRNQILQEEDDKDNGRNKALQKGAIARTIASALEEGKLTTREDFDKLCIVLNVAPTDMVKKVREYNRDRGIATKLNEYFTRDLNEVNEENKKFKKTTLQQMQETRPKNIPNILLDD